MSRHLNIPVFIPHLGCPNQCVFCNQRSISGVSEFKPEELTKIIDEALLTVDMGDEVEIAFFGGSFTGIDYELMVSLLDIAYGYVKAGRVNSIRCSTRPDYINGQILDTLKRYGVKVIELGLQSISEPVLLASKRGHTASDAEAACRMIVDAGFELVGQMMIGLPRSDEKSEMQTAEFIIKSGATAARIYPTVVFLDTELCAMTASGEYSPLTLDEAVRRSALVYKRLTEAGVKVIRTGLCTSENLSSEKCYYAGPNHPAIGELVENEIFYGEIYGAVSSLSPAPDDILKVYVARGAISKAVGHRKKNKLLLTESFGVRDILFLEDAHLHGYELRVEREEGEKKCT